MENLVSEGLMAPISASSAGRASARASSHAPVKAPHSAAKSTQTPEAVKATGGVAAAHSEVAKSERHAQETLSGVQSKLMMPVMLQFGYMLLSKPFNWVTSKLNLPRVKTVFGSIFGASSEALTATTLDNAAQLPANFMKGVAAKASEAGLNGWAKKANEVSSSLSTSGDAIGKSFGRFFAGIGESKFVQALPNAVKLAARRVAGVNLFTGLLVTGITAGVGASLFGARAESKEAKEAYQGLMSDIENKNGEFAKALTGYYKSKTDANLMKAGLETVGGAVNGVVMAKQNIGFGLISVSMLPDMCAMLVPDKPLLGACEALRQADAGKLSLDKMQRTEILRQMIAIMPNVAKNGGEYNRLVTPIAKELATREMSAKEVVNLLNDSTAFTALAKEVNIKQQAAKAAQPIHEANAHVKPVAAAPMIHGAGQAANEPQTKGLSGIQHQGRIAAATELKRA